MFPRKIGGKCEAWAPKREEIKPVLDAEQAFFDIGDALGTLEIDLESISSISSVESLTTWRKRQCVEHVYEKTTPVHVRTRASEDSDRLATSSKTDSERYGIEEDKKDSSKKFMYIGFKSKPKAMPLLFKRFDSAPIVSRIITIPKPPKKPYSPPPPPDQKSRYKTSPVFPTSPDRNDVTRSVTLKSPKSKTVTLKSPKSKTVTSVSPSRFFRGNGLREENPLRKSCESRDILSARDRGVGWKDGTRVSGGACKQGISEDMSLEDFFRSLKYLRRSPKKKEYNGLWKKRWKKELKESQLKRHDNTLARQKLIIRLREAARRESLESDGRIDYSLTYCIFEMIFSASWDPGGRECLSALDYQAKEIGTFKKHCDVTAGAGAMNYSKFVAYVSYRPEISLLVRNAINSERKDNLFISYPEDGMPLNYGFWNLSWTWERPIIDFSKLLVWQRVNHFPESIHLTRKDLMKRHIEAVTGPSPSPDNPFGIIPKTYAIPDQYAMCANAVEKAGNSVIWIVKPAKLSRGRGIYLINNSQMIPRDDHVVVSRYISDPLLLDGFKFDLRLYVLVTSFQVLEL
ncbi:hypothetical protein AAMO2058_001126200 [Amorphochlora amoebiformis]